MSAIRVLHVVGKMHRGGIETLLMNLYRNIDRNKVQFDFLVFNKEKGYYDDEIIDMGGRIFYAVSRRENYRKNKKDIKDILYKHPDIKIIHDHLSSCSYIMPLIVAKKCGIKTRIAHSHNTMCGGGLGKILHYINKFRIGRYATNYFGCANAAGEWMFGLKKWQNGTVISNGTDCSVFKYDIKKRESFRKKLQLDKSFVVGFIGRFEEQKNPLFICDIFIELKKKYDNAKLLLVGEGSYHNEMDELLKKNNLVNDVIYTGIVDNVYDYIQVMDVVILPSLFEGLPVICAEIQASGVLFLMSDKISAEAKLIETTKYLPIDKGVEIWVEEIEKEIKFPSIRESKIEEIKKAGYDIKDTAKKLEKFYLANSNDI